VTLALIDDRADLALRRAVAAGLRALDDACEVLGDRVRGDKAHLSGEAVLARELRLLDRGRLPEGRRDRERLPTVNVIKHEPLALLRDGAA
jgi:hypothetical protein